jgi:hypothetical protein
VTANFNNTPILNGWTFLNNVFTCVVAGTYSISLSGIFGITGIVGTNNAIACFKNNNTVIIPGSYIQITLGTLLGTTYYPFCATFEATFAAGDNLYVQTISVGSGTFLYYAGTSNLFGSNVAGTSSVALGGFRIK